MNATVTLTKADNREMVWSALRTCPDIHDDEAVINHLHLLGLAITAIDRPLAELIDEARHARATGAEDAFF